MYQEKRRQYLLQGLYRRLLQQGYRYQLCIGHLCLNKYNATVFTTLIPLLIRNELLRDWIGKRLFENKLMKRDIERGISVLEYFEWSVNALFWSESSLMSVLLFALKLEAPRSSFWNDRKVKVFKAFQKF